MDVLCVGMYRACSTWQYEIACHLMDRHRGGTRLGFLTAEQYASQHAEAPDGEDAWRVLKTHDGDARFAEGLIAGTSRAIYAFRDLRDVVYSLMHKAGIGFDEVVRRGFPELLLANDAFWRNQPGTLCQRYEAIIADPGTAVRQIAHHLGLDLAPEDAGEVARLYSLEANRKRTETLAESLAARGVDLSRSANLLIYDSQTLLHWNHLRDGLVGSWRSEASAAERRVMAKHFGRWLVANDYAQDSSWVEEVEESSTIPEPRGRSAATAGRAGEVDTTLRLAVVGSPRSGNTWVRGLLASLYELEEIAVRRAEDLDWENLPARCVIQIHHTRDDAFRGCLDRQGVRVVVPVRHPLDVLISALNYSQYVEDPPSWVDDRGVEQTLFGATPNSPEFLAFASRTHRGSVLSVSPDWWHEPGVIRVRYEDLVDDPAGALGALAAAISPHQRRRVADVVGDFPIDVRRANPRVWQFHFGQGRPGLWRELLPAPVAQTIAEAQKVAFEVLGYRCDPDPQLTPQQADSNWFSLQTHLLRRHLRDERARHEDARAAWSALESQLDHAHSLLYEEREGHARTQGQNAALKAHLEQVLELLHREREARREPVLAPPGVRIDPGPGAARPASSRLVTILGRLARRSAAGR